MCWRTVAGAASFSGVAAAQGNGSRPFRETCGTYNFTRGSSHKFWDRKNGVLFATTAALSTADFVATRNNLQNGGRELNPVSRVFAGSTAGLALNFAGETVGVIGVSYLFHKSGHHKLERAVTILNIGASATAVSFDLLHH